MLLLENNLVRDLEAVPAIGVHRLSDFEKHARDACWAVDVNLPVVELVVETKAAVDVRCFDAVGEWLSVAVGEGEFDVEELGVENPGSVDADFALDVGGTILRDRQLNVGRSEGTRRDGIREGDTFWDCIDHQSDRFPAGLCKAFWGRHRGDGLVTVGREDAEIGIGLMGAGDQWVARVCGDEVQSDMVVVYVECGVEVRCEIQGRVRGDEREVVSVDTSDGLNGIMSGGKCG